MFSNRGEEQFVPHETMAVEHFAEIFFAPGGSFGASGPLSGRIHRNINWAALFAQSYMYW
jgi:hypothetical protein